MSIKKKEIKIWDKNYESEKAKVFFFSFLLFFFVSEGNGKEKELNWNDSRQQKREKKALWIKEGGGEDKNKKIKNKFKIEEIKE